MDDSGTGVPSASGAHRREERAAVATLAELAALGDQASRLHGEISEHLARLAVAGPGWSSAAAPAE
ncbi:hypothetical protein [Amycolatopsis sp. Hca4]|uniref:hypothetical protein n=1 Tax=Amycolatopsis sp. Hca4 TaxID=2742131 RepID=UPI00158FDA7C|nr:hypothetical protein [Amycolatopsis sp. Hca4]QKV73918.1 hypothetical protein HUT10_09150 [Amycolatopsis sp. Hca4]